MDNTPMVGIPKSWLIVLLRVALGEMEWPSACEEKARALLVQVQAHKVARQGASLERPTGTAEKVEIDKTLEKASSISATPSWTVSRAHG